MKALVTGANGFIGSHLVDNLLSRQYQVYCLYRKGSDLSFLKNKPIQLIQADLVNQNDLIKALSSISEVDEVYHCVGLLGQWGRPEKDYWQANVVATENILKLASQLKAKRFFHLSSAGVIGPVVNPPADETTELKPSNIYEATKAAAEKLVLEFGQDNDLAVTVIRPEFVYGPRDRQVLKLIKAIKAGWFFILGRGQSLLHPTYIADLITALEQCSQSPKTAGQVYIIAGPKALTVKEIAYIIADTLKAKKPPHLPLWLARPAAWCFELLGLIFRLAPPLSRARINFFTQDRSFSTAKARKDFNYLPQYSLAQGLAETIDWYQANHLL